MATKKDKARRECDRILDGLFDEFKEVYQKAYDESSGYFKKQIKSMKDKLKGLEGDELIKAERELLLYNKQAKATLNYIAKRMADANADCVYMVQDKMVDTYLLSYNFQSEPIKEAYKLTGEMFSLLNKETLVNLMEKDPFYLPLPEIERQKYIQWYGKKINSAVLASIEKGEEINKIANRFQEITSDGWKASVRNARTYITASENQGRYDRSQNDKAVFKSHGYTIRRKWIGTDDGRERPSHVECNNTYADPRTGRFKNGLRFPCDPLGAPSEIWNCRCTMIEEVVKDEEL